MRDDLTQMPRLFPLIANVHSEYIAGVGMVLYYNFIAFHILLFLLLLPVHFAFRRLWLSNEVFDIMNGLGWHWLVAQRPDQMMCPSAQALHEAKIGSAVYIFANTSMYEYAILYLICVFCTVVFADYQKRATQKFIVTHDTMYLHALSVRGFPPEATDERDIKSSLERAWNVELAAVSIPYNVHHVQQELRSLIDRHVAIEDIRAGLYGSELSDASAASSSAAKVEEVSTEQWLATAEARLAKDSRQLLEGLQNSGEVFAVFKNTRDRARVFKLYGESDQTKAFISNVSGVFRPFTYLVPWQRRYSSLDLADGNLQLDEESAATAPLYFRGEPLAVYSVRAEPVSICWYNFGLKHWERVVRAVLAVITFFSVTMVLFWLFLWPFVRYVLTYTARVHERPGGFASQGFGILLGTTNWVICVFLNIMITNIGFLREDRQEVIIFACFTLFCVANTFVNVGLSVFWVFMNESLYNFLGDLSQDGARHAVHMRLSMIDSQMNLAQEIRAMLFPGAFVPCLLWPINGFVWPFLQSFLGLRFFYKKDSFSVRQAEQSMEPLPIGLAWDYQGLITIPVLSFVSLFLISTVSSSIILILVAWHLFFYCWQRYCHLRLAKTAYCTSNRLDTAALYAWCLCVGQVSCAASFWGMRAHDWHPGVVVLGYVLGVLFLWILLMAVRPLDWQWSDIDEDIQGKEGAALQETRAKTLFDWVNCNPVLVLKSRLEDLSAAGVPPQSFFIVGKAHAREARRRLGAPADPDTSNIEPGVLYSKCGLLG
eukprot:gnl/TRDRNA2_/TRDRNA2_140493_c1_seq1.p1 gnl/TRDRNA2_/TRDRNA2_140493_c1~~gnl/TRDRNA2_/TRDRNA2_140493_c1_seq1.p1  ORF type:complete len:889 (+),score=112.68 gnl/TRDRNA2_/TRDRNA2_140493_c1_seq1:359-2668(+)